MREVFAFEGGSPFTKTVPVVGQVHVDCFVVWERIMKSRRVDTRFYVGRVARRGGDAGTRDATARGSHAFVQ